jgi:hypothetical protein
MMVRDIDGNEPVLKKDTMHRRLGRSTDPVDAVYIPLDGIDKVNPKHWILGTGHWAMGFDR